MTTDTFDATDTQRFLRLLARFGGLRPEAEETRRRVRYYVHKSELARIASRFRVYAEAERRLR
jgi:hypothetical protein